ncbi:hypothetical protein BDQ17DRAFT_1335786 [Cyathus striatus]|nr:hypothetical protein BDQ17DRAFT_1335786 [Cyathus striatus]
MSTSASVNLDAGCAVHDDGVLKDASEIVWYNDIDDSTPLSNSLRQCSLHTAKPSQYLLESKELSSVSAQSHPSTANSSSSVIINKQPASGSPSKSSCHAAKKTVIESAEESGEETDVEDTDRENDSVVKSSGITYEKLQGMAEVDYQQMGYDC